jgi:2-polyprenyl-3-methyl-5-hydroxy-6-metoxy-1,4-benzoquinol methylase
MKRMVERTAQQGVVHHIQNPVRVYGEDDIQKDRIHRTIQMARKAMAGIRTNGTKKLFEVGCGTADISGALSYLHGPYSWMCYGIDCHQGALLEAMMRYNPRFFTPIFAAISPIGPGPLVEMVILSEVLEHLEQPQEVAKSWLRRSHGSVISHPLDEPVPSSLSGGDHTFSFTEDDHRNFFASGGHSIDESETFEMGAYKIILSRGHRI